MFRRKAGRLLGGDFLRASDPGLQRPKSSATQAFSDSVFSGQGLQNSSISEETCARCGQRKSASAPVAFPNALALRPRHRDGRRPAAPRKSAAPGQARLCARPFISVDRKLIADTSSERLCRGAVGSTAHQTISTTRDYHDNIVI